MKKYLLDSNIFIYLSVGKQDIFSALAKSDLYYSEMTEIEIFGYHGLSALEKDQLQKLFDYMTMLRLDATTKNRTKYCMQIYRLKTVDAIIVATAIVHNLILVTADAQLQKVSEVDILLYKP